MSGEPRSDRRGMALAGAIFALVVIGALVAVAFYAGRVEQRGGASALHATQALEAAEAGLADVLSHWDAATFNALAPGAAVALDSVGFGTGVWYRGSVARLNRSLVLVRAQGMRRAVPGGPLARREVGTIARLDPLGPVPAAAITALGSVTLDQQAHVDGTDATPAGWGALCDSLLPPRPGLRVGLATAAGGAGGCTGLGCVHGAPALLRDTALAAASFARFGAAGAAAFDSLAARADRVVAGAVGPLAPRLQGASGSCDVADSLNWGEPHPAGVTACRDWFPVIYAPGTLRLAGGSGQGVLLVRGDLELTGDVDFYGPVVVLGAVRTLGAGGRITGGLMVLGQGGASALGGLSVVRYSSCAVQRANAGSARPTPLAERSWLQLF